MIKQYIVELKLINDNINIDFEWYRREIEEVIKSCNDSLALECKPNKFKEIIKYNLHTNKIDFIVKSVENMSENIDAKFIIKRIIKSIQLLNKFSIKDNIFDVNINQIKLSEIEDIVNISIDERIEISKIITDLFFNETYVNLNQDVSKRKCISDISKIIEEYKNNIK